MVTKAKSYVYTVIGHGEFPQDMLRYDCAWPLDGDVWMCRNCDRTEYNAIRVVKLASARLPTKERWASFGWSVERVESSR